MGALVAPGTPIAVVAPSHAYNPERLAQGMEIAAGRGHDLRPLPDLLQPHRYFAAPPERRLTDLVTALTDPTFGAVWIARGGSGLMHLLPHLPYHRLSRRPVIGFSDVVALHLALSVRVGGPLVHGPVLHSLPITDEPSIDHLFALLEGRSVEPLAGEIWVEGEASGPLVGGNLTLLASTCGTPFQLDASGAVLVLEDVGEKPYRVDRALQQLHMAGVFEGVAGVAVGTFVGCDPDEGASWTIREVLLEHLQPLGVAVLGDLPVGHGPRNHAFPWGVRATLADGALRW